MTKQKHVLIGKPVHILKNGKIHNQGQIIQDGEYEVLIQRFSFVTGDPTDMIYVKKKDLFDTEQCRIYEEAESWHRAYFTEGKRHGWLPGSIEDAIDSAMKGGIFSKAV